MKNITNSAKSPERASTELIETCKQELMQLQPDPCIEMNASL